MKSKKILATLMIVVLLFSGATLSNAKESSNNKSTISISEVVSRAKAGISDKFTDEEESNRSSLPLVERKDYSAYSTETYRTKKLIERNFLADGYEEIFVSAVVTQYSFPDTSNESRVAPVTNASTTSQNITVYSSVSYIRRVNSSGVQIIVNSSVGSAVDNSSTYNVLQLFIECEVQLDLGVDYYASNTIGFPTSGVAYSCTSPYGSYFAYNAWSYGASKTTATIYSGSSYLYPFAIETVYFV